MPWAQAIFSSARELRASPNLTHSRESKMLRSIVLGIAALGATLSSVMAQSTCNGPSAVGLSAYGATCTFFGSPATLGGSYDQQTCTLTLRLSSPQTCCNTFLRDQAILIGASPIIPGLPSPILLPGCEFAVNPFVVLPPQGGPGPLQGQWQLRLPTTPIAFSVYAQGVNQFFTTIGFSNDFQLSNGLQIDIM